MTRPYAESCDQNRDPILEVIRPQLMQSSTVLEIGSGTGQHAVYFASKLPHLLWHTSDRSEYHNGIRQWLKEADLPNIRGPITLDVIKSEWPVLGIDAVFTANTAHIMHDHEVTAMIDGTGKLLSAGGLFILYGPVNYNGQYTSESNRQFNGWLKERDPLSGIPDFEVLQQLAAHSGLELLHDYAMPANNRTLIWQKTGYE